jgi:hypothetical protein
VMFVKVIVLLQMVIHWKFLWFWSFSWKLVEERLKMIIIHRGILIIITIIPRNIQCKPNIGYSLKCSKKNCLGIILPTKHFFFLFSWELGSYLYVPRKVNPGSKILNRETNAPLVTNEESRHKARKKEKKKLQFRIERVSIKSCLEKVMKTQNPKFLLQTCSSCA